MQHNAAKARPLLLIVSGSFLAILLLVISASAAIWDITPPSIKFVSPTPPNGLTVSSNYIEINAYISEAPLQCLLNWYNGTWSNLKMQISGQFCSKNMTGLSDRTYMFRVYATDLASNTNVSQTRQNGVKYFQPACGNGICEPGETAGSCPQDCFAKGVYAMCGAKNTLPQNVLENEGLAGAFIIMNWEDIETSEGAYNWAAMDARVAEATAAGLEVTLQIFDSPLWAPDYINQTPSVQKITLFSINKFAGGGATYCSNMTIPAFWDPLFHQKKLQIIRAAGAHFSGNPDVIGITASFANTYSGDWGIPVFIGKRCSKTCGTPCKTNSDCPAGETCSQINQTRSWLEAGYSHEKMLQIGKETVDTTASAFPNQIIRMPISDTHKYLDGSATALADNITSYAYKKYPNRFYAQMDFLSTNTSNASQVSKNSQSVDDQIMWLLKKRSPQIGLQFVDMATGGEARECRQNGRATPCPAYEVMDKSLEISLSYNPAFIEIWCADATQELEPLLADATDRMGGSLQSVTKGIADLKALDLSSDSCA